MHPRTARAARAARDRPRPCPRRCRAPPHFQVSTGFSQMRLHTSLFVYYLTENPIYARRGINLPRACSSDVAFVMKYDRNALKNPMQTKTEIGITKDTAFRLKDVAIRPVSTRGLLPAKGSIFHFDSGVTKDELPLRETNRNDVAGERGKAYSR
ncbi:hypothetical protein EVAR_63218_1 [Eumeta japonica]|uniref:Uncharacterized protein n=1 Tax=Eumeta variegata TaxID=151549 RepID=A0A4C1ZHJ6_EUMVA|nr:hypothetical protein EVAR_63218_1 [Eumeta japonica]